MKIMKLLSIVLTLVSAEMCLAADDVVIKRAKYPTSYPEGLVWKSEIPKNCPFEQSELFNRVYFTGKHSEYFYGDTFYPSLGQ